MEGLWAPMDSPTCPMVQWDKTDSGIWGPSDRAVGSLGHSHLSHGTVGILMAHLDIMIPVCPSPPMAQWDGMDSRDRV